MADRRHVKQALSIAAGLSTASMSDLTTLNVAATGASAGRVNLADAAAVARLGL